MVGTLTGILIAGVALAEVATVAGQVTALAGPVTVTRVHVSPQPLKVRDDLYGRDVVEAHKDGSARLLLGGKMTVTVRELSRLELREERRPQGMRYTVELLSGKVRASVARMLMQPGEQVEVRTPNAVSSVRGTDFIVQTISDPRNGTVETVVVTLSGVVEVSNRLSGTGAVERIGPSAAVRVNGTQDPVRFQVSRDQVRVFLQGLTAPRPQQRRSGNRPATAHERDIKDEKERGDLGHKIAAEVATGGSGKPEKAGKLERLEKPERPEKPEKLEKAEEIERAERPAHPGRPRALSSGRE